MRSVNAVDNTNGQRIYNFGAGPAMLPPAILQEVREEFLNWRGSNMSVLEIGHRSPEFMQLMDEIRAALRALLNIPADYHIIFLSGATRAQFAMLPLNFLSDGEQAGYIVTGLWSSLAYKEACRIKPGSYCVASSEANNFLTLPTRDEWRIQDPTRYIYCTPNETTHGVRLPIKSAVDNIPLIGDLTSTLLSEPINVENYALIFAGAQKNIANAGLTIAIIQDQFLQTITHNNLPTMLDYRTHVREQSLYATPPTFNCYLAGKMFAWISQQGGVAGMYANNCKKAAALYEYIDNSSFYYCKIAQEARSLMNVCFWLQKTELEGLFISEAAACGLLSLKGHRVVGGLRASIYNAMPLEGVYKLIEFMTHFAKNHE